MPVPSSPQLYRRVVTVDVLTASSQEEEFGLGRPPTRKYSEAFSAAELTGSSSVGGFHRSRERTRQSKTVPSVLRLVERRTETEAGLEATMRVEVSAERGVKERGGTNLGHGLKMASC